ncbi:MAG TPA: PilZ domain-containing protein [Terriglobales bacterium]|nr:PilZ domain-containing protein [Terriglobales bacterium]
MVYCPEITEVEPQVHRQRRQHPRFPLRSLSYVKLDQANGGIVRDINESGIAIQAVAPLQPNREVKLSFDLLSPRVRVETTGHVAWSDPSGQGGIQFSSLTLRTQRALRDWILTQMLSGASLSGRDSMFQSLEPQLILSAASRPAIVFPPAAVSEDDSARVAWGFLSLSIRGFSIFVDTLVLLCAILLFSISSLAIMGGMPAWPLAAALFFTTSLILVAVYQLLFSELCCGATPGRRLALLASAQSGREEQIQRFR